MDPKMIIVVRAGLKMRRGKESAQCGHAVQYCVQYHHTLELPNRQGYRDWADSGAAKIVLSVDTEEELIALECLAKEASIMTWPVIDHGRTEIPFGTLTCIGFGPDLPEALDPIFGHLKLR